jgi:hypothetical protein
MTCLHCNKPVTAFGLCHKHRRNERLYGDPLFLEKKWPLGSPRSFIVKTLFYEGNDCIDWPFSRNNKGRGLVTVASGRELVTRVVCEALHGLPPSDRYEAAHSCGRGKYGCISPSHLSWKTPIENERDKLVHGTRAIGIGNGQTKLSDDDVNQIRLLAKTESHKEIARRFHISKSHTDAIIRGTKRSNLLT